MKQKYMVRLAYNRGQAGKVDAIEEYLSEMGGDGWIFCGQITRDWISGGEKFTERFDVFRRPQEKPA